MINLLIICLFVFSCEIYSGEVVGKSFLAKHNDSYRSIEVSKKKEFDSIVLDDTFNVK